MVSFYRTYRNSIVVSSHFIIQIFIIPIFHEDITSFQYDAAIINM